MHVDFGTRIVTPIDTPKENTDLVVWLQDYANYGLSYLIDYVHGKSQKKPELLQVGVCFLYLSVVNCNYTLFCCLSLSTVTARYVIILFI